MPRSFWTDSIVARDLEIVVLIYGEVFRLLSTSLMCVEGRMVGFSSGGFFFQFYKGQGLGI